jgi:uncharacterized protein YbaR (Trm112 family)
VLLELTEVLRCPRDHEESFVVCVSYAAEGRHVVRGVVGCPHCQAEFPIVDGVLRCDFGRASGPSDGGTGSAAETAAPRASDRATVRPPDSALTAEGLSTFLDLRGPGGYVVLAGGTARLAGAFAALAPGVHVVAVNAPAAVAPADGCSWIVSPLRIPLKASQVRGVALGADCAAEPWLGEAARVLLRGLRVVVEDERAGPAGITELARGAGVFVGAKA